MEIQRPESKQPIPPHAKMVFRGVIFDAYQWEQEMYDGTKATFEKLKRADTVIVFGVLPDGKIILTKQEQPGAEPFLAATGGRVEEGEDILVAAARELLEESGYEAKEFTLWDAGQPVAKIDWVVYIFIAKNLEKVSELKLDAGEKIELMPVTFEEMFGLVIEEKVYFPYKEIIHKFLRAKLDHDKMNELREIFRP